MAEVKWIKLNVDMFDDEKIKIIQAMPDGDALLVVWIKLIALAGKTNDGGYIYISEEIPYTEDMLAIIMNKPIATIRLATQTFISLGMIENDTKGIYLVNFEKHQSLDKMEKIKEQNRLRKQKERERKKLEASNIVTSHANVTQCHATDIDKDKDLDKDKENNKEPPKRFTKPTLEEVQAYCQERQNGVDAQKWYNYYEAVGWKVGRNPMKDWKASVRTWERTEKNGTHKQSNKSTFDYDQFTE